MSGNAAITYLKNAKTEELVQIPESNDEMAEGKKEKAQRGDNNIKEQDATIPKKRRSPWKFHKTLKYRYEGQAKGAVERQQGQNAHEVTREGTFIQLYLL